MQVRLLGAVEVVDGNRVFSVGGPGDRERALELAAAALATAEELGQAEVATHARALLERLAEGTTGPGSGG